MRIMALITALSLCASMVLPTYARGGGFGGGFGGGRSFGGFSGGGRSFGGFDRSNFGGGFGGGAHEGAFGGGFNRSDFGNRGDFGGFNRPTGGFGDGGFSNRPGFAGGNRPDGGWGNRPDQPISTGGFGGRGGLPTDGGFGHISNWDHNNNFNRFNTNVNNWHSTNIRNSFNQYNNVNFNHYGGWGYGHYGWGGYGYGHYGWWGYPSAWYVPGWSSATAWTFMGLESLTSFLGIAALAGGGGGGGGGRNNNNSSSVTNVTYDGGNVYINGNSAGTAADYYAQAQSLANVGTQYVDAEDQNANASSTSLSTDTDPTGSTPVSTNANDWRALGVFSLAQEGQTDSSMLLQLAINKDGIIRGNYFNQLTNESSEIQGSLDKKTQRISWTIGQNSYTVFDTNLADLAKNDAPVLVHYGPDNTKGMMLVRLQQPQQTAQQQG